MEEGLTRNQESCIVFLWGEQEPYYKDLSNNHPKAKKSLMLLRRQLNRRSFTHHHIVHHTFYNTYSIRSQSHNLQALLLQPVLCLAIMELLFHSSLLICRIICDSILMVGPHHHSLQTQNPHYLHQILRLVQQRHLQ